MCLYGTSESSHLSRQTFTLGGGMKRKRRVIQDDFPIGDLDRDELTRAFAELREKRLARERRARGLSTDASPEARAVRKQRARPASGDAVGERSRAA